MYVLEEWKKLLIGTEPVKLPHKSVYSKKLIADELYRLRKFAFPGGCILKKSTALWSLLLQSD